MKYLIGIIQIESDCKIEHILKEVKYLRGKYSVKIWIGDGIFDMSDSITFMLYSETIPKNLDTNIAPLWISIFRDNESGMIKIINKNNNQS